MFFFSLLLFVCAFDATQSKAAFPRRNDLDKIAMGQYHGSDHSQSDGPEVIDFNTVDEPAEATDGLSEVEFAPNHSKEKRWVSTEVNVEQLRKNVQQSKQLGKRQSRSFRPSSGGDVATLNEEPFRPVYLRRYLTEDRLFTDGELGPEPNRFVYKSEAEEGTPVESHDDAEHQRHVLETMSLGQKHRDNISKRTILQRPSDQEKHLRDICILCDYLDRQRARKSSRQPQLHRQKNRRERKVKDQLERWTLQHPSPYDGPTL